MEAGPGGCRRRLRARTTRSTSRQRRPARRSPENPDPDAAGRNRGSAEVRAQPTAHAPRLPEAGPRGAGLLGGVAAARPALFRGGASRRPALFRDGASRRPALFRGGASRRRPAVGSGAERWRGGARWRGKVLRRRRRRGPLTWSRGPAAPRLGGPVAFRSAWLPWRGAPTSPAVGLGALAVARPETPGAAAGRAGSGGGAAAPRPCRCPAPGRPASQAPGTPSRRPGAASSPTFAGSRPSVPLPLTCPPPICGVPEPVCALARRLLSRSPLLSNQRVSCWSPDPQMWMKEDILHALRSGFTDGFSGKDDKQKKFLKSLIRKQPQELLLVIGTGVSAAVAPGIPALCSWRSCIEAVIEAAEQLEVLHPGDVAEFRRKVIKDRDLLVVAHDLIRKMSPRTGDAKPNFFQDCLMEVFDSLEQHIQHPAVLHSILSLMDRGTMVLTTNYDNLLEIFGQQQNKPMESLDLKDKSKVLQWARGHIKYGVLHIHGLYTDPCGMVLDPSGYKDVTQDPEVMEVLQDLYRTKSFLFVGCGETLRDQIFQALFLYSVPNKVDLEHFMLVLKEHEDHFFKHQADMLLHGIKVVSYGDHFDHFPGYVQDLATQICTQRSPDAERVDSTTFLGNACQDCAKRKMEKNGMEVSKKPRSSDTDDAGGS